MDNLQIRKANKEDINNGLLEVFIEGYRYHQNGRPDIFTIQSNEELEKDLIRIFESDSMIVITDNNKILGYLSYIIKEKRVKLMDIDQLVIKETNRGQGLGRKLMDEAKKIAKENNCARIVFNCWSFNENALKVYDHMGFKRQRIMYEMNLK